MLPEVRNLPAPLSCSTSADGSLLQLFFYDDYKLMPSSTYLFVPQFWNLGRLQVMEQSSCIEHVGQL